MARDKGRMKYKVMSCKPTESISKSRERWLTMSDIEYISGR